MNIYKLSQTERDGYDTFSDCVVIAASEDDARTINPENSDYNEISRDWSEWAHSWASTPENVTVELIGVALLGAEERLVCASYHAG